MILKNLLEIKNLNARIENKNIIKNLNLNIYKKEIHILMGPNGSGKSSLTKILAGHPNYTILSGQISFLNKNLLELKPDIRAKKGIFVGFQYPIEMPGILNYDFLKYLYITHNKKKQKFENIIPQLLEKLKIKSSFLERDLNNNFSGGEKKKNELLQLLLIKPKLAILDEIDSGLDIDATKLIYTILNNYYSNTNNSLILITHNLNFLNYLKPNYIHILRNGSIIKSGTSNILKNLDLNGFTQY